ncbi:hypothetical protein [Myxococcus eversor]|uniref:hypothetical protein n=1 Tax=Myxococcus eversor TaxID=2709661 RepID=UPI0013D7D611|nr:hypothetical protein [Myxococcus eversor]
MHVTNQSALLLLGMVLAGCGALHEDAGEEVKAQACPAGVASRTKVVNAPGANPYTGLSGLVDVEGTLYFTVTPVGTGGAVLWRSNGTDAGTVQVKVFPAGVSAEGDAVAVGNKLFFQLHDSPTGMAQLWVSDGSASGTRLVRAFTPGFNGPALLSATAINGRLVFFHLSPSVAELWSSDGTSAGTVQVASLTGVLDLYFKNTLQVGNGLLFFRAQGGGMTLWRTDGTVAGTTFLKQLDAGAVSIAQVGRAGDQGLFVLRDGMNHEVWKTNGTAVGTLRLDTFGQSVRLIGGLGSKVYLARGAQLYSLSLSGGGRTFVTTLSRDNANQRPSVLRAVASGGSLYFSVALEGSSPVPDDVRLWVTNGTASGTRELFRSLHRSDDSYSPVFATGAGDVFFTGSPDGTRNRPWFTRGTVATTGRLANVNVPVVLGLDPDPFVRAGSRVFFPAIDETGLQQLWSVPASFSCPPGLAVSM